MPEYEGYKQDIHPGIAHVFQSAAFRFGHSLIPPGLYRRDDQCNYRKTSMGHLALRLCSTWWDSNVRKLCSLLSLPILSTCLILYSINEDISSKRFPKTHLCISGNSIKQLLRRVDNGYVLPISRKRRFCPLFRRER